MKKIFAVLALALVFLGNPTAAFAQAGTTGAGPGLGQGDIKILQRLLTPVRPNTNGQYTLGSIIITVINLLILAAGVIAIAFLIWAGINYITAGNDPEKAKKARQGVFNAIIGIIIVVISYVIIQFASSFASQLANPTNTGGGGTGTSSIFTKEGVFEPDNNSRR